jgi:hypothetical protein
MTEYDFAAFVHTCGVARSLRLLESIEAGMLGTNPGIISNPVAPFGGVKQSGPGRDAGSEEIVRPIPIISILHHFFQVGTHAAAAARRIGQTHQGLARNGVRARPNRHGPGV